MRLQDHRQSISNNSGNKKTNNKFHRSDFPKNTISQAIHKNLQGINIY
jgi:hypothetical protein